MATNNVPAHARDMGEYLTSTLGQLRSRHPATIADVRGIGLLLAVQFSDTIAANVVRACNEEGLLLNPVRPNAIRLMPPLIITRADVDEAIEKLERGMNRVLAG